MDQVTVGLKQQVIQGHISEMEKLVEQLARIVHQPRSYTKVYSDSPEPEPSRADWFISAEEVGPGRWLKTYDADGLRLESLYKEVLWYKNRIEEVKDLSDEAFYRDGLGIWRKPGF